MEELSKHDKDRFLRVAEASAWGMSRSIYPICELLMAVDFELYNKFEIQQQYRDIMALQEKLEKAIKSMRKIVKGDSDA
tara:strand:- start:817 stop:1053 length:237 start_codon:yes stop_codon:yes gene_type:complete